MDSRRYREQHRRDRASVRHDTITRCLRTAFQPGFWLGERGQNPGLVPARQHSTSELHPSPTTIQKTVLVADKTAHDQLDCVNTRDAAGRPGWTANECGPE